MNKTRQLLIHLYISLLHLYPAGFREEFADEMSAIFAQLIGDASLSKSKLLLACWRELRDYPTSLFREHWRYFRRKEPNMAKYKEPDWYFYPAWIILTALSVPITIAFYILIIRIIENVVGPVIYINGVRHITEDYLVTIVFFPTISLFMGIFQYGLLRRYLPRMGWWAAVTFLSWIMTFIFMDIYYAMLTRFIPANVVYASSSFDPAFFVLGFIVGFGQWLILRKRLPRAGWWIVANIAGWGVLRLVTGDSLTNLGEILVLGFLPAIVTAVTMGLLLHQSSPSNQQGTKADGTSLA